jgi:deaminated glutathione amidase
MRIALHQMTSGIDPAANAAAMAEAIHASAAGGAAMMFAPEMSLLIDQKRERSRGHIVPEAENPHVAVLCAAAKAAGIWVHAGSLPVCEAEGDGRFRNRSIIINPEGAIVARYDKLHLFDVDLPTGERWRESHAYAPGEEAVLVETPAGPLGLTICYDLRFAALFDALALAGARVVAVPAAFTVPTGEAHWHMLLRARAVDHGLFIIAPAQVGMHADGRKTYGHSLVIDPWGDIVLDMGGDTAGLGFAELDFARLEDVRSRLPVLMHRRAIPAVKKC